VEVEFENDALTRLEEEASFDAGLSRDLVKAFRKRMQTIRAALDERDFYALKSLHFEKLKGQRKKQYSMRLNDQYRLIVKLKQKSKGKVVIISSIEDYH